MAKPVIYTIGHSDLSLDSFIKELQANKITLLIDVRKLTGSDAFPQFNEDKLGPSLLKEGIRYRTIPQLAGRRPRDYKINPHINGAWENQSFHNYADYATHEQFRKGLSRLENVAAHHVVAIMCAEAVPWRCHRRIIADHLLADGYPVEHIMDGGKTQKATYNPGAKVKNHQVTYPGSNGSIHGYEGATP